MISIIVAFDDDNAIGADNQIPWHLSADLRRFKATTTGHTVIMGRNTWLSLPFKPLKNRRNIVVSTSMSATEGCEVVGSIDAAFALLQPAEHAYIMGGASIYRQTIERADELIVTRVFGSHPGADTFFPDIEADRWVVAEQSDVMCDEDSGLNYQYITYTRK